MTNILFKIAALCSVVSIPLTTALIPGKKYEIPIEQVKPLPIVERLIYCETRGRNLTVLDSNGKLSKGVLQFQDETWDELSKRSGIVGTPYVREDAIRMANWAIDRGELWRWRNCAEKIRALAPLEPKPKSPWLESPSN